METGQAEHDELLRENEVKFSRDKPRSHHCFPLYNQMQFTQHFMKEEASNKLDFLAM